MTETPLAAPPAGVDTDAWNAACEAVRRYCGWHIAPSVSEVLTLDGPGGTLLRLPSAHVTDVTEVTNDGTVVESPEWSQYGMIRNYCWTRKFRAVTVELTHGFDECPADIVTVAADMAGADGRTGASGFVSGPHQVQFGMTSAGAQAGAVGMSDMQRSVLDRYRLGPRP